MTGPADELSGDDVLRFASAVLGSDDAPSDGTRYRGDAYRLGVCAMGPLLLGFSLWLLRSANGRGVRTLHFLARDGDVMKAAFDVVARHVPHAPRSTYVLASRRAALVAATRTPGDVAARLVHGFGTARVGELLSEKLGVARDRIDGAMLARHGLALETRIAPRHHARVRGLVDDAMPIVLEAARHERDAYVRYLASVGFRASADEAVVDIGYSGSMQLALDALFGGRGTLAGFYLVTVDSARHNLGARGLSASAYLGEHVDRSSRADAFFRHVAMFETLFSNEATSFVRIDDAHGALDPVFQAAVPGESIRIDVVREIHRGALAYVEHASKLLGARVSTASLAAQPATAEAERFFADPHPRDARIFAGVPFENAFGASFVVPLVPRDDDAPDAPAMWEEGRRAVLRDRYARSPSEAPSALALAVHRLVASIAPRVLPENKANKLRCEPSLFFADTRSLALRYVGRHYLRVV